MSSPSFASRRPGARRVMSPVRLFLVAVVLVLASACQVQVVVDTEIDASGAGTVQVAVGLDEGAQARVGDLETEVRLDDLRVSGWEVTGPTAEADGLTWIRASKPFANPDQLDAVLAEIAGPDTIFKDVTFTAVETDDDFTYRLTGTVDLTGGTAVFGDDELAAQLNGDPFGGNLAAIEAEEGQPVSDMVDFEFRTTVAGGTPFVAHPTLADTAPVPFDVSTVEVKPASPLIKILIGAAVVVGIVVVVVALAGTRRRVGDRF